MMIEIFCNFVKTWLIIKPLNHIISDNVIFITDNQICNMTVKCVDDDDYKYYKFGLDTKCYIASMCTCLSNSISTGSSIDKLFNIGPYLYPFSIEFNILIGKYLT